MKLTDAEAPSKYERLKLRAILAVLGVIGVLFSTFSSYAWHWLEPIVREFGSALVVSAVIGTTVDFFFKEELARDAFIAAFRYVLPSEFKEEVAKVLAHNFISNGHSWKVKIEKIPGHDDMVLITTTVERKITNRTSSNHERGALYTVECPS